MDGWNLLILFLLFAGHCELMAFWINRIHALHVSRGWLTLSQRVHDLLVIGFLPYVVWRFGVSAPYLVWGGSWLELPPFISAYFALCGAGLVSLAIAIIRRQLRPGEPTTRSEFHDVAASVESDVTGPDWRGRIAGMRGNEATKIEVNEKRIVCPRLPAGWEGLSIAHISDVHFYGPITLEYFQFIFRHVQEMRADMICFTGDLLDDPRRVDWIADTFGTLTAPLGCWFILGNHDQLFGDVHGREKLISLGWQDLGGQSALLKDDGRTIWLGGDESPWFGKPFDPTDSANADFRILLSHTPDHFPRAKRLGIDLVLAGHNHGGQVCLPLIGPVYSPSRYGVRYASGTYRDGPSVMHVSRGISAKRPLRWNCPPEVTRLILTASETSEVLARDVQTCQPQHDH